jgi:signal transduction histidine kinase
VFSVRDNGRGMSEDFVRSNLFKPFNTTKPTGLGVGLAQCKAIVEAHGGTIRVESRLGRGTTFLVRIPVEGSSSVGAASGAGEPGASPPNQANGADDEAGTMTAPPRAAGEIG